MGDFLGHAIPGSFFLFVAIILLRRQMYNFCRATEEGGGGGGVNVQGDAVERSSRFLIGIGSLIGMATFIGIMVEGLNGYFIDGSFFKFQMHEVLYLIHGLVGVTLLLEGLCLLPYDTSYYFLSLAKFQEALLWWHHASMQSGTEQFLHYYLALIPLFTSLASVVVPSRPQSHRLRMCVTGGFLSEGIWMYTNGIILYCGPDSKVMLTPMQVPAFAALVVVLISLLVAIPFSVYMHHVDKLKLQTLYGTQSHPDCKYEQVNECGNSDDFPKKELDVV